MELAKKLKVKEWFEIINEYSLITYNRVPIT